VQIPHWQAFVPGMRVWTPDASGPGRVVVVMSPPAARRDGWSGRMTLDLLDVWGDSGHRVVLADCVLEHPTLHREAGLANEEGVVDAALFGASVSKVARPAPGRSFYLVSAGAPSADPDAVASSPRWLRVEQGFRDARVTLVLFLRAECAGFAAFLARADDVIVLSDGPEGTAVPEGLEVGKVRAHLGPEPSEVSAVPAAAGSHLDPVAEPVAPLPRSTPMTPGDVHPADEVLTASGPEAVPGNRPTGDAPTGVTSPADPGRPAASMPAPSAATERGRGTTTDPKARQKLLLIVVGVVILVLVVLLGVVGSG